MGGAGCSGDFKLGQKYLLDCFILDDSLKAVIRLGL